MCVRVTCDRCQKPTFAGCGLHVEQVLSDVPATERCTCGDGRGDDRRDAGATQPERRRF